jgi:hypothetical protein
VRAFHVVGRDLCVREAFAALRQARTASGRDVRAIMARIAPDEVRHGRPYRGAYRVFS